MKILQVHIYGFYRWIDQKFDFPFQFHYIYGQNESGKTSLQQFLLFVLYGSKPKERKQAYPKTSSRMGGRVTIEDPDVGIIELERLDSNDGKLRCILKTGEEKDESWFQQRSYYLPKHIFESIFSFSTEDLHPSSRRAGDELSQTILDIGLTGAKEIRLIERDLAKRIDSLFKKSGKLPIMNQQITELDRLEKTYISLKKKESTYNEKIELLRKIQLERKQLNEQLEDIHWKLNLIEKKMFVLPTLQSYSHIQHTLTKMDKVPFIAKKVQERFYFLRDERLHREGEIQKLQADLRQKEQQLEEINVRKNDELYERLDLFVSQLTSIRELQTIMETEKRAVYEAEARLETEMTSLQVDLTVEALATYRFPFYLREDWTTLRNKELAINERHTQLQKENDLLRLQLVQLDEDLLQIKEGLLDQAQYDQYVDELKELNDRFINSEGRNQYGVRPQKQLNLSYIFLACSLLLILIGLLFYQPFIIGGLSFLVAGVLLRLIKMHDKLSGNEQTMNQEQLKKRDTLQRMISEQVSFAEEYESIQKENKEKSAACIANDEELFQLEKEKQQLEKEVRDYVLRYPFLQNIERTYWTELLSQLIHLQTSLQEIEAKRSRLKERESLFEASLTEAKQLMSAYEVDFTNLAVAEMFIKLEQKYDTEKNKEFQRKQLMKSIRTIEDLIDNEYYKLQPYIDEQQSLIEHYECSTIEMFLEEIEQSNEKVLLQNKLIELEQVLDEVFPRSDWLQYLKINETKFHLQREEEILQKESKAIKSRLEMVEDEFIQRSSEIKELEGLEKISELKQRKQYFKEQFESNVKQWLGYQFFSNILNETKNSYEEKYLQQVLEKTNCHFTFATNEKYIGIELNEDQKSRFLLKRRDGLFFSLQDLSRGTLNLFYACLKVATSEVMAENHRLPFLIDDAFLHLDEERRNNMLSILQTISQKHQVLYFSCVKNHYSHLKIEQTICL